MEALFLKLVNMSITASYLVLVVILFRLLFKNAPKYIRVILWGLVALRLIFPFSIESVLSLVPSAEPLPEEFLYAATPQVNTGIPVLNNAINPAIAQSLAPAELTSANPTQIWSFIFSWVWVIGVVVMAAYALISYLIVRKKVGASIPVGKNLMLCDDIGTPFILGIIRPKIYLPSSLNQQTANHVLAHENAHLKRHDHWWKPLGFALLTVYWFNPVMWIAYILLCRDIETACDEKVIKELGTEEKKAYSAALLSCSVPRRMIAACPLAFGEVGVKSRIKSVLNYRKPAFWIVVVAVISCIVVAACFLTDPKDSDDDIMVIDDLMIIDDITSENGYKILNQNPIDIRISIPKSALPESIYSQEGQTFAVNDIVVYETGTTLFYLDSVRFANEGDDLLYFKFNSIYTPADSGTLTLLYSALDDDVSRFNLWVQDTTLNDDHTEYPEAVSLRGIDGGTSFTVYVDTEVCKAAEGSLNFTIANFTDLTYAKDGVGISYKNISDLTSTLTIGEIDRVQATLWGEYKQHIDLTSQQVEELVGILNGLEKNEFISSNGIDHTVTVMILCAGKSIGLQWDGETVWFLLDSKTAENLDGSWAVRNDDLNAFIAAIYNSNPNRLAVGNYVTTELIYWPVYSSYYWEEDPEYHYQVTQDDFYSEYEGETFEVDWQWRTVAACADDLVFFFEWYDGMSKLGPGGIPLVNSTSLYQRIDNTHHLFLIDDALYLVEGYDSGVYLTNVSAIYRLEPEGSAESVDPETDLDTAIRAAILQNNRNDTGAVRFESHVILSQLVACGVAAEDGSPSGYTEVSVLSILMHTEQNRNGVTVVSQKLIPATLRFDEYPDRGFVLTDYWQYEGSVDTDKSVLDYFENPATEDATVESYVTPLTQSCYAQAVAYFQLNTDLVIDNLLDTISASPAQYSNAGPYIDAHPAEYETLINYGTYTLQYCFNQFLNNQASGIRAEIMAAACRDIGMTMGEDISFEGQYINSATWFDVFHANAAELYEANVLDALAESNRASWVLLNMLADIPMPIE